MLVIIGGFIHWFGCSLLLFIFKFLKFFIFKLIYFIIFNLFYLFFYYFSSFFLFFLPFLLSHVADIVLELWQGVRPEPPRWESKVQDIGLPETSWPHVISIGESSPRYFCLNTKTQLHPTARKLQGWTS